MFPIQEEKMCFTSEREEVVLAMDGVGVVSCLGERDFERCVDWRFSFVERLVRLETRDEEGEGLVDLEIGGGRNGVPFVDVVGFEWMDDGM
jgi:hypothetical protein